MTFEELREELFARGTDYLEEDAAGIARGERWLNQAYREIANIGPWPFVQATSTGPALGGYAPLTDLRKIRAVVDVSVTPARKLDRISFEDLLEHETTDITRSGSAEYYYTEQTGVGTVAVSAYPVGGTIKVYYLKRLPPLSGIAEPVFDEEYHNLIVDKAMIKAYVDSDNYEAAASLQALVDKQLIAMAEDYLLDSRELQYIPVDPYDG